jgi:5'-methylthioadenosine phosphorylase
VSLPVVPEANYAIVGGTGSLASHFPADLHPHVRLLDADLVFATPWGDSPPFALIELGEKRVLHVQLHGWRNDVARGIASRQVFSVLHRAGVQRILADAGVGSLNRLLDPGDLVIADDFVDRTTDRDRGGAVCGDHLLIMREPVCPVCREALRLAAKRLAPDRRLFPRGVYVVTEGPRFESPAEVDQLRHQGDIIGQSFVPEVWLARDIGACYAGIYVVVNYGEGVVRAWEHEELARIFYDDARLIGRILLEAISQLPLDGDCQCRNLRKPSLLR